MFNNKSIGYKFYTILFSAIFVMMGIVGVFYFAINTISNNSSDLAGQQMYELQKDRIKDITLAAIKGLEVQIEGKSPAEKLQIIDDFVSKSRFDVNDSGYFFVYEKTVPVVHPVNRALQGKDLKDTADSEGVKYVTELYKAADRGGDFVTYVYPKPDGKIELKTAYAANIAGTSYWMGTGVYTDNVNVLQNNLHTSMMDQANTVEFYIILAVFIVIVLIVFIAVRIINSITRPIGLLTKISADIAGGNLDAGDEVLSIASEAGGKNIKDEVVIMANAINKMVVSLKEKIRDAEDAIAESKRNAAKIQDSLDAAASAEKSASEKTNHMLSVSEHLESVANKLSTATQQLTQIINHCEHGAADQAEQISHTSNSMEEMNHTVSSVAQNASLASTVSDDMGRKASHGGNIAIEAINSMQEVENLTTRLMEDMQSLDSSAKSIDQVMGVISEIADQTNLLALNAAIEAARAGDAGRGFAVVADEVRKLAEKTMQSTSEVAKIITEIQKNASQSLTQASTAFEAITKATNRVQQSGDTLSEIVGITKESAAQVQSIATAAEEQAATSQQIKESISNVNVIALSTVDSMNEASMAVSELSEQAKELISLTASLKSFGAN